MIRAIVFDCFGVLATEGWRPFKRKHFADRPELNNHVTALAREANAGRISYGEFVSEAAQLAGVTSVQVMREISGNVPDEELFDYIAKLKPRMLIGLLSNAAGNWLPEIFTEAQLGLIDAIALSYEIGFIKPERQAYETIATRLGVAMSECLMVDDQTRYCQAAKAAGMAAMEYRDCAQFKRDLPALLKGD